MNTLSQFKKYQIKDLGDIKGGSKNSLPEECPAEEPSNIVTADLQTWWRDCRDGKYDRRDISI